MNREELIKAIDDAHEELNIAHAAVEEIRLKMIPFNKELCELEIKLEAAEQVMFQRSFDYDYFNALLKRLEQDNESNQRGKP